ncbi:fimbrial chaperone [Burkholderia sp. SFA1]|uniref:fimbria/pilus periplasmic chaperone n=1 Tax=unclassified Caballeronia TaxID=2646786 RepID=UPI001F4012AE|nr:MULTISPECIES: fimbria/pilus periplasmic chaperone [unclassified Caballeronia]MCE4544155.1 fimbria/pilus periplasmic chaperone [Caballeronia sp. PC1]MCE4571306.1 fimbria/pilus periplasmic chaperone [Caballeronia sp. CLC5]BBP98778.1 fimbrial chaperone [Burkholderia sp. SFA1]
MKRWIAAIGLMIAMFGGAAHASVTIGGTRVVYPLDQREVTVKLNNDSRTPSLVQVWMDDGNADTKPAESKTPFVITPPIFRMDANKSQTLRVMFSGEALPQDRESIYWLNVLDVPPKAEANPDVNTLQLAYRTRIKVFVRPPKLPGKPEDAPRMLDWKIVPAAQGGGNALAVSNPTAYYVSFSEIQVTVNGRSYKNETGGMVAPHGKEIIAIPKMSGVHAGKVHYIAISDFGGAIEGDADATE